MAYKRQRKDFEADLQKQESPFVFYGTALPPLDDHARDDGSYVPVWKQQVTDDRGRKRLHGAFTGGFSAGYFNTVGSKEGWTPAAFVSSRTNRAKDASNQAQQRPEDFMDEEDIREQEESRHLSTSTDFMGFGTADDPGYKNTLMDLFRPTEDTMGTKLLNRMGWKQGHGIGPKVRRKADAEDDSSETRLFAPDDAPMLSFIKKTDHRGLGFSGQGDRPVGLRDEKASHSNTLESQSDETESRPGLSFAAHAKKPAKSTRGAFGVGILNDTGSDEEDPYSMGPRISFNKTLGGDKKVKRNKTAPGGNANPLLKNRPVFVPKKFGTISDTLRKCHDGRLPLDGFVLADQLDSFSTMSLNDDKYKPPTVPDGWKPARASSDPSLDAGAWQSTAEAARSSSHTSTTRGSLLGEAVLPGKSVFDYLTPAAREKLMNASGKKNLPPALGESLPGALPSLGSEQQIPTLDSQTALQALSRTLAGGFTPYPDDSAKASRYKAYLESQANIDSDTDQKPAKLAKPPDMTQEDFTTELHEFARAAEVFKPVSGLIASRFTTATSNSLSNTLSVDANGNPAASDLLTRPTSRLLDPAEEAARVGMFGPLTRSISSFFPTRLLCKRFGVAMPTLTENVPRTPATTTSGTVHYHAEKDNRRQQPLGGLGSQQRQQQQQQANTNAPGRVAGLLELLPLGAASDADVDTDVKMSNTAPVIDPDRNEALEQDRPGAAVFRAIFGSDDDDDDDDDGDD